MGIQINGQTDTITATDGSFTIQGASGNLTGDLVGNVTGNVTGNLTGTASTASNLAAGATLTIGAGSTSAPSLAPTGDSNTGIFFPSADTIAFGEGGAEAARFDSSGRLLVGTTTSPSAGVGQYAINVIQGQAGSSTGEGILSLARGTVATSITNGQTLGQIVFTDNAGNTFAKVGAIADGTISSTSDLPGALVFSVTKDSQSSPTERARITNLGYFKAIGDESSYYGATGSYHELRAGTGSNEAVNVTHTAGSPAGVSIRYTNAAPNNTGSEFLFCRDTSAERAVIRSNGGLVNYQANNVNLSDINTKKDITLAAGTWDCIKEWEIVNYRYKDQPDDADLNLGVIAQQVAESCPEVVIVFSKSQEAKPAVLDDDGNEVESAQEAQPEKLGVKEQQMYWMAIKALQEAQLRIETLEAEVAALKAQ